MTCCERLALLLNTALTVSLGDVNVGRDMLTRVMNELSLCPRCDGVRSKAVPKLIAGMGAGVTTTEGMGRLAGAVSLLMEVPWDDDK